MVALFQGVDCSGGLGDTVGMQGLGFIRGEKQFYPRPAVCVCCYQTSAVYLLIQLQKLVVVVYTHAL